MTDASTSDNFPGNCALCKLKKKITGQTKANDRKDVKIVVPLKYVWTLEMPLINCEINLIHTCSANCVLY